MTKRARAVRAPSKKVTISLPKDLFLELEQVRSRRKLDRSSWVQQAVSEAVHRERRTDKDRAYVESYRRDPEVVTKEEITTLSKLAAAAWADLDE